MMKTVWAISLLVSLASPYVQSRPAASGEPPQYYIHFGRCPPALQQQQYGNWVMTRKASTGSKSIVLYLDTRNMSAVANAFGEVEPLDFPIQHIYFAYFNTSGVFAWSHALDRIGYKETGSFYQIRVNGKKLSTIKDLKDSGTTTPMTSAYSLKGTLYNGTITPSLAPYKIEITRACTSSSDGCVVGPDPATVFTSPTGHIVFSLWSVKQPLKVKGVLVHNHAWCPVQTVVNVR
ncbi:hypothetical protein TSOC_003798 [Tetrabaena socialis]|uniref:Uncharacterized protein n=1 Tax=Tetrabaena socialis TaxID=47790 RepID=A0A2J8AAL7_9CHLO|nr:hypothetical protein TSOC_003798 [Tetrabaena socialis]|eukprot:PNH09557.1 hypothetical protein TSOC_003798 [Tetrabaena socialis]